MEFEWDEAKRQTNLIKHGIDFADAVSIFDSFVFTRRDMRADYGEKRYISIGLLGEMEIAVIHTPRNGKRRIISVRRARVTERKMYYENKRRNEDGF